MEVALCFVVAALFSVALYLLLSKHIIRMLLGVVLLGNAVNLLIFTNGRIGPQALILTAIVISFSFFAFLLVLAYRAYQDLQTDDTDRMRVAEPEDEGLPPLGY